MEIIKNSNTARNLSYLLIGGGIGATLALLFAPKSGSELRGDISKVTANGLEKTRETVDQLRESAGHYYENAKDKANNFYSATADKVAQVAESVKKFPEQAEDFIEDKAKQIGSAVYTEKKEFQKNKPNTAQPIL